MRQMVAGLDVAVDAGVKMRCCGRWTSVCWVCHSCSGLMPQHAWAGRGVSSCGSLSTHHWCSSA